MENRNGKLCGWDDFLSLTDFPLVTDPSRARTLVMSPPTRK